ncbi:alpha/beta hydrolase [Actinacidiphila glaucinigra]|uniref:alpha/beta hydrolase n=1 Tax=Actinacidiphila glaucinigra TaxID=235986 RepID=UPI0035D9347D
MKTPVTFPSSGLSLAGILFTPDGRTGERLPAVVVSHPFTGVKEQTAGIYAERLARAGFAALTFDAAYQGQSEGEPRRLEDPFQRAEDIKSAVSFLTTRDEVDPERIGALGICASGGYVPYAAQTDLRVKAVATVSAVDLGGMFRDGVDGNQSPDVLQDTLSASAAARSEEARGQEPRVDDILPTTRQEAESGGYPHLMREGFDYYRTERGHHPRSTNLFVTRSLDLLAQYDSYARIEMISPRPLLMIAGTEADTARFSREAVERAAEPKDLFWIDGATHMDLYDKDRYVTPAVTRLTAFFTENLTAQTPCA